MKKFYLSDETMVGPVLISISMIDARFTSHFLTRLSQESFNIKFHSEFQEKS